MPHMPKLCLSCTVPADPHHKRSRFQTDDVLADFAGFWEDDDPRSFRGGRSPVATAPTFAMCTPRTSSSSPSKPLRMFNLATPRRPEVELATTNDPSFSPPWPCSSHWPFNRAPTTLELQNLPRSMTEDGLVQILDNLGLSGMYNFIYVPWDAQRQQNQGHAIINSDRHADGCRIAGKLREFCDWAGYERCTPCVVSWSFTCQGLENLVQHCHNSWHLGHEGNYKGPWVRMGDYWVALPHLAGWYTTSGTCQKEDQVQDACMW